MKEIIAIAKNPNFMILQSVGIEVYILDLEEDFKQKIKQAVSQQTKIIIYDTESSLIIDPLIEKYDESLYPVFLKLPTDINNEDTLLELKKMIEKSLGISVI